LSQPTDIDAKIEKVLEKRPLHYVMLFFHMPAGWPGWLLWAISLLLAASTGWLWLMASGSRQLSLIVAGILWLFMATDLLLLINLPRKTISFGPWKAQFIVLALPRLTVVALFCLVAPWLGWYWSAGLVVFVQSAGTAALIWGAVVEPFRLQMTEQVLLTDRLPADAPPIRLLHISDLHVERWTRREEQILELARQAKPDLILISGDYVNLSYNRDPVTHAQIRELLGKLSAPYGVYATLGSPPVDLRETIVPIFEGLPVELMREAWVEVDLGQGRQLVLIGMDCTHHIPTDEARLQRLVNAAPNSVPQILLYHSPELMPQASRHGLDLYLCGHTHGGQVRLPLIGPILTSSQLGRRYVMGLYKEGRTHLYVSRGIGLEGLSAPRVRFLSPPEITLITLTAG
jgi:predicted MPP superfamily phosphohydrolase